MFLGDLYSFLCFYDEKYFFYKKAYDQLEDPPAALLLRLRSYYSTPGILPITEEESEYYLKKVAAKEITLETAFLLRNFYKKRNDYAKIQYWDQIYQKLNKENIHADFLESDIFQK